MTPEVQDLLEEGDALLDSAFVRRDPDAYDRLYAITHELTTDHRFVGAELARRWHRDRRTISVWKKLGAKVRANGFGLVEVRLPPPER